MKSHSFRSALRLSKCSLLILVLLWILPGLPAQSHFDGRPDSVEAYSLKVIIRTHNFFKDNEYKAEKLAGYTLPGFTLEPVMRFDYDHRLSIEAGLHLLHFWGADQYPLGVHYGVIPNASERHTRLFRVKPVMRVRLNVGSKLNFVLGSLYNNQYHQLPMPLYNRELSYAADPETGAQILMDYKHFSMDLWIDWQQFSFRNSTKQEQFVFGCSAMAKPLNKSDKYTLSVPFYFLAQHHGGELMQTRTPVVTAFNAATGLDFRKYFAGRFKYLQVGCLVTGYTHSKAEGMPFQKGWGIYPSMSMNAFNTTLELGYWRSGCFIPLLGLPHFGNISTRYSGLVFDPMTVMHAQLSYAYDKLTFASVQLEAGLYVYPPFHGDRPGYDKVIRGSAVGFDFGLHVKFNPEFSIKLKHSR